MRRSVKPIREGKKEQRKEGDAERGERDRERGCWRKRAEMEREGERRRKREGDGWMERARQGEKERINSSGALVPHYPGRALSPWQCGRKRIAQA